MKQYYCLLICCFALIKIQAQKEKNDFELIKDTSIFKAQILDANRRLAFNILERIKPSSELKWMIEKDSIVLSGPDLSINLLLTEHDPNFDLDFNIALIPENASFDTIFPAQNLLIGDDKDVSFPKDRRYQFIWEDALENHLTYRAKYDLLLVTTLRGDADCSAERPVFFKASNDWYHFLWATLNASSFVYSYILNQEANDSYENYVTIWANEGSVAQASASYNEADKKEKNSKDLQTIGLISSGIQLGVLTYQFFNRKDAQKTFDTYCSDYSPKVQLTPGAVSLLTQDLEPINVPALCLTYKF